MPGKRLLIIDASLNRRMAAELRRRGREATNLNRIGAAEAKDPVLLRFLHMNCGDNWVLITYDDHLPEEHASLVKRWSPTVAIIDPYMDEGYEDDQWQWDVMHRWAHKIEEQERGTIRRYSLRSHRPWKKPRRPRPIT